MKAVQKGSIVLFKDLTNNGKDSGHYRVTSLKGGKVNLGSVFGKHIYFKGIPLEEVIEDEASWYEGWTRSESYMCM
jgi:hypothetical protein